MLLPLHIIQAHHQMQAFSLLLSIWYLAVEVQMCCIVFSSKRNVCTCLSHFQVTTLLTSYKMKQYSLCKITMRKFLFISLKFQTWYLYLICFEQDSNERCLFIIIYLGYYWLHVPARQEFTSCDDQIPGLGVILSYLYSSFNPLYPHCLC